MWSHISEEFSLAKRHAEAVDKCQRLAGLATRREFWRRLRGERTELICFEDVVKHKAYQTGARRLQSVPVEQIRGSIGHRQDFTREFLPRRTAHHARWVNVEMALATQQTLPPVELYQVGEVYFVVDGHHRVSVANARGFKSLEAFVTPVTTTRGWEEKAARVKGEMRRSWWRDPAGAFAIRVKELGLMSKRLA